MVLMRNGTVTHAFGMDQREVGLSFTAGNGISDGHTPTERKYRASRILHAVYFE